VNDASLALAARVVLAIVLAASAIAKLRSRATVERQMGSLVGERYAPMIAPALPVAELVVAIVLVGWWSPAPGVVALVLLAAFTVVLVRAQARHVPCLCFGAARLDVPVGPASVLRNGVLAGLAVFAIGRPSGAHVGATVAACLAFGLVAGVLVIRGGGGGRAP
jgi:Methylamine utilisation protein MauE